MSQYAIYLRKSRKDTEAEQRGEGETLARHRKILLAYAEQLGLPIAKIYEEVVSGESIATRPQMQQLLADVERELYSGVLVMEVERLARGDTMDQGLVAQTFKYSDTKIITPAKTYDPNNEFDEEYFEFGLFMSRREYKTINRRLQQGRRAAANEGKFTASRPPYGYEKVKIANDKGYTLNPIPEQAAIVKNIFDWYVNGLNGEDVGLTKIANYLNSIGVPSYRNDYWGKEALRDIVTNPVYCGMIRWGYRRKKRSPSTNGTSVSRPITYDENCVIAKGLHEAIVSKEVFEAAQLKIKAVPPPPVGYKKELKGSLAGLIMCKKCGHKMTLRSPSTAGKPPYLVCHYRYCDNVATPYEIVERRVLNTLDDWAKKYRLKEKEGSEQSIDAVEMMKKAVENAQRKSDTLQKQLDGMYDLLEQGVYTPEIFRQRSQSVSERLEKAKAEVTRLSEQLRKTQELFKAKTEFIPKVEHILKVYDTLEKPAEKNQLLKEVIECAEYSKEKSGAFKGVSVDDFELLVYPKMPL